jgi:hypothetical protein
MGQRVRTSITTASDSQSAGSDTAQGSGIAELADARLPLEALRGEIQTVRPGDQQIEE